MSIDQKAVDKNNELTTALSLSLLREGYPSVFELLVFKLTEEEHIKKNVSRLNQKIQEQQQVIYKLGILVKLILEDFLPTYDFVDECDVDAIKRVLSDDLVKKYMGEK